jgi:fructoselysine and glucoselysine-specific PTS system IIC component
VILKTFAIFLLALFGYSEWLFGTSYIQRPIVMGPLVGLLMGNLQAGIIMGGSMELAMVGAISIGAYIPPDLIAGTILGVSLAIQAHASTAAALTLGIPIATIALALNTAIGTPLQLIFVHRIDHIAERADTKAFTRDMLITGYIKQLPGLILIPAAFYFGQQAVTSLLNNIPDFISNGMNIAAGLLPALGFAMLAQMIFNKKIAVFFFLGFFLVAYAKISTTGVAIFAIILVVIMYLFLKNKKPAEMADSPAAGESKNPKGDGFDEF